MKTYSQQQLDADIARGVVKPAASDNLVVGAQILGIMRNPGPIW